MFGINDGRGDHEIAQLPGRNTDLRVADLHETTTKTRLSEWIGVDGSKATIMKNAASWLERCIAGQEHMRRNAHSSKGAFLRFLEPSICRIYVGSICISRPSRGLSRAYDTGSNRPALEARLHKGAF